MDYCSLRVRVEELIRVSLSKHVQNLFGVLLFVGSVAAVHADLVTQANVTIRYLTSHDGNVFAFNLQEGLAVPCAYNLVYCPSSNSDCKNRYAMALTAKTAGKRLREVRYFHNPADNRCTLWLIAVE